MNPPARQSLMHAQPPAARMLARYPSGQRPRRMCGPKAKPRRASPHKPHNPASYKQYTFTPGMDLASAVPLDTQALLAAAEQGAQSNAAEGWVKNLSTSALQTQLQLDLVHRRDGVQGRLLIQF